MLQPPGKTYRTSKVPTLFFSQASIRHPDVMKNTLRNEMVMALRLYTYLTLHTQHCTTI
jgi:hypothetical protein